MADRVFVRGVEFYGFHGCSEAEREIGHRYVVDLDLEGDLREAGETDALDRTIDYARAVAIVLEIGQGPSVRLLETLAERIAQSLLETFAPVHAVRVAVSKRLPPVNAVAASAGVEIVRRREPTA